MEATTLLGTPETNPRLPLAQRYLGLLLGARRREASQLILDAVENDGVSVREIYLHVFQPVQYEIGRLWQHNEVSVAQEHFCTAVTQLVMSQLYPRIFNHTRQGRTMVATSIGGELHEIGIRMVADFFEMEGWDTYYLGANTPADAVVTELVSSGAQLLALSVTLDAHLDEATALVEMVRSTAELDGVKLMLGGLPFRRDPELWRRFGADGSAADAEEAVALAARWVEEGALGGR